MKRFNDLARRGTVAALAVVTAAGLMPTAAFAQVNSAAGAGEVAAAEAVSALAAEDDIASGTSGTCSWVIDADGVLTVSPTEGDTGTLEEWFDSFAPWFEYNDQITSVKFSGDVKAQTCNGMFDECTSLVSVDFTGFDTSAVTDMAGMFYGCTALTSLDLSGLDTSAVTDMAGMFYGCTALTSIDLYGLDTSAVTDMGSQAFWSNQYGMFAGCTALTTLNLSSFDTAAVTDMSGMFYGDTSLVTIEVGDAWNTDAVTSSTSMFSSCTALVGGSGTMFDSSKTGATYARVDGGAESATPGYFTQALSLTATCASADKGEKATVTTELAYADAATYRFYYSADGVTWTQAARNTTGTTTVTATPTNVARQWKVVATAADGRTAKAYFQVTINDPVVETTTTPAAKYNTKAVISVTTSHYGTYGPAKYKYYYSADEGVTWKQVAYHNKQYTAVDFVYVTANGTNAKRMWKVVVTFKDGRTAEAPFTVSYGA